LAEQHRHELAPAGKALGVALSLMLTDGGVEVGARDKLQNLGENAA
jgi:hypothetical protein